MTHECSAEKKSYFCLMCFSISSERHRAEVRRATNDETLTTVADQ